MFKVKLLLSVLVVSSTNLFAVEDLKRFLPAKAQDEISRESGYNETNAKMAAVLFWRSKHPRTGYVSALSKSIKALFADGRRVVKDSDICDVIAKFEHDKDNMIKLPERSEDGSDREEDKHVAVVRMHRELDSRSTFDKLAASLAQISPEDIADAFQELRRHNIDLLSGESGQLLSKHYRSYFALEGHIRSLMLQKLTSLRNHSFFGVKVDLDSEEGIRDTLLIFAARAGFTDYVRQFVAEGASSEVALIHAAAFGRVDVVQHLIENGVDMNATTPNGNTALMMAAFNRQAEVVRLLIANGDNGEKAIMRAIAVGRADTVRLLIENGVNGNSLLMHAASFGKVELVRHLIENGIDKNTVFTDGTTALTRAAWKGHVDVVRLLADMGANLESTDSHGNTALKLAVTQRHIEVVKSLIEKGADSAIALRLAAGCGSVEAVRILIENGGDFSAADSEGNTALMKAARYGHTGVVELLLKKGARFSVTNLKGDTALRLARLGGHSAVVKALRDRGAKR